MKYCYENARINLQVKYVCNCLVISQSFCSVMKFYARILLRPLHMSSTKVNTNLAAHKLLCSYTAEHYIHWYYIPVGLNFATERTHTHRVFLNIGKSVLWLCNCCLPFHCYQLSQQTQNSRAAPPNPVPVKENGYVWIDFFFPFCSLPSSIGKSNEYKVWMVPGDWLN